MSRTVRFTSTLFILAALTCGSLGAWPLGLRVTPATDGGGDFMAEVVEWIASFLTPGRPTGEVRKPAPTKDSACVDPSGIYIYACGGGH